MDSTIVSGRLGRALKQSVNKTGRWRYPYVTMRDADGVQKKRAVHLVMMAAFMGPRPDGLETLHANGNPEDSSLLNLSYGTSTQNHLDMVAHGTHFWANKTECPQGHEYTPDNIYSIIHANGRPSRHCKTCTINRAREYKERKRNAR